MFKKLCAAILSAALMTFQMSPICGAEVTGAETQVGEFGFKTVKDVKTLFDGKEQTFDILHINEYPAMALEDISQLIGASLDGTTLSKDGTSLTFSEGNRLAADKDGHIMLECTPKTYKGRLYVPVSFVVPVLHYNMQYNRFDKLLTLSSGSNYPDTQQVFYVKDYEDNKPLFEGEQRNDLPAITKAINAALNCGVPARVEFESQKTYVLGERMDRWAVIHLEDAQNITLEGNGCEILIKTPTNTFIEMARCQNVKVKNFDVDYEELPFTQGIITATDLGNGKFTLRIDDGFPQPADDEWVKYHSTDERSGGWWFGQLMDSTEDRMKYTYTDNLFVDSVSNCGHGEYEITIRGGANGSAKYAEVGDRFVLNSRYGAYSISDSGAESKQGSTSGIYLDRCADIEFDGVYMYSTPWMFCGIGLSEGKTTFKNSGFKTKPGRLLAANSDGIHTWLNRGALVLENCTFENSLDDHNNTYTQGGFVRAITGKAQYKSENEMNARIGDEIQVYNPTDKKLLGRAFVKDISKDSDGKDIITLDREFDQIVTMDSGSETPTLLYDIDSGSRGNSIKNCTFTYGRRYAVLERSVNSIIENNKVIGCGSGIGAMNELTTETKSEGGFPSSLTVRGNEISGDGNTYGYVPLEVRHWKATADASRAIDGVLVENNSVDVPNTLGSMELECINDLYLLNNTVTNNTEIKSNCSPVMIRNCDVRSIDGMTFNCGGTDSTIKIFGSDISETDIKNINVTAPASAKPYEISETEPVSENFETGSENIVNYVFPNEFMSVPEGYKADTALSYESHDSGKALCVSRTASEYKDIGFIVNMTDNIDLAKQDGTLTLEFDCKASALKVQALKDSNVVDLLQISSLKLTYGGNTKYYSSSSWHKFKICVDYINSKIDYYLDNSLLGSAAFSNVGTDAVSNRFTYLRFVSWTNSSKLLFDNFKAYFTPAPRVVRAEFTDSEGTACKDGSFVCGLHDICIKFNTAMDGGSLNNSVTLNKGGESVEYAGTYDSRSRTYIMRPKSGDYFDSPAEYTVTVSKTASSSDGRTLYEDAQFSVSVGDRNVSVTAFDIVPKGGNVYDITAGIINGDAQCNNAVMIFAMYDNSRLSDLVTKEIPLNIGMNNISNRFDVSGKTYDEIKAFLWSSLSGIVPYAEAEVITGVTAEDFSQREIKSPLKNESVAEYVNTSFPEVGSGDYAMRLERIAGTGVVSDSKLMHNITLAMDLSGDEEYSVPQGKTFIGFDYLSNNNNNVTFQYLDNSTGGYKNILIFYPQNAYGINNTYICDFSPDTTHHVEVVIDYDQNRYSVRIDENEEKTFDLSSISYSPDTNGTMRCFRMHSWAGDTMYYQLDNLVICHE